MDIIKKSPLEEMINTVESPLKEMINKVENTISPPPPTNYLKIVGYILLFLFLISNIYTYYFYGVDLFRYSMLPDLTPVGDVTRPVTKKVTKKIKKNPINLPKIDKALVEEEEETLEDPEPDSAVLSEIQEKRKNGWCYIGTDRGYRSCVEIGKDDICLSGKVFDEEYKCKNPNLR